jgi:hypothetical protein
VHEIQLDPERHNVRLEFIMMMDFPVWRNRQLPCVDQEKGSMLYRNVRDPHVYQLT